MIANPSSTCYSFYLILLIVLHVVSCPSLPRFLKETTSFQALTPLLLTVWAGFMKKVAFSVVAWVIVRQDSVASNTSSIRGLLPEASWMKTRVGSRASAMKLQVVFRMKIWRQTSLLPTRRDQAAAYSAAGCPVSATVSACHIWQPKMVRRVRPWEPPNTSAICVASFPNTISSMLPTRRCTTCVPIHAFSDVALGVDVVVTKESAAEFPLSYEILRPSNRSRVVRLRTGKPSIQWSMYSGLGGQTNAAAKKMPTTLLSPTMCLPQKRRFWWDPLFSSM